MKLFKKSPDGGVGSGVTAFFLIEWKSVFSIAILRFNKGGREAFHSHAFNALTWWLKGSVDEERLIGDLYEVGDVKSFKPSLKPKFTPRENMHRIIANRTTYALTLRGPWSKNWKEVRDMNKLITLTHGRNIVNEELL